MINSGDLDFSFSGIKTAVLYTVKQIPRISAKMKAEIAHEFETAAAEVLVSKTRAALKETKAKAVLVGGGVSANKRIRAALTESLKEKAQVYIPDAKLSTDNAIMIAVAAYMQLVASKKKRIALTSQKAIEKVVASGNMKL
jgi:N6-L-threonylcarbamoyladenine synthase